jgi:hypothetical protein
MTNNDGYLTKIKTRIGETFALELSDLEWIALPYKEEEKQEED